MNQYEAASEAAQKIRDVFQKEFSLCLMTGTGGEALIESCVVNKRIPFSEIPHLKSTSYLKGEFLSATLEGQDLLIINGRLHYYEGFSAQEITFPIRIVSALGIKLLIMTNASGGLNPSYTAGEVVLIRDHINLMPEHPLRGIHDDRMGLRFPDMSNAYDKELRERIQAIAKNKLGKQLPEGVYVGFQGPSLETPAEYKYLNTIGGDMVGMSTVPEVIVANQCGIKTAVLSVVTNVCYPPEAVTETTLEEVVEVAERVTQKVLVPIITIISKNSSK